ncbi:MAG: NAD-dependent deacylase [Caldisericaceae bacterium]|nr:NAD-dependent deacylase [Caldisericaceae bacterium]
MKSALNDMNNSFFQAAQLILQAKYLVAFTGAGISVESGIPPFRGPGGLWTKVDPRHFEIGYFEQNPEQSWRLIKQLFYESFKNARPNPAHLALATLEKGQRLKSIITQNIDYLHQQAGSRQVIEYHGSYRYLRCLNCNSHFTASEHFLNNLPPHCLECAGLLKPDFVFFGEAIPEAVINQSIAEAMKADVMLIIGSTGEVFPASQIPEIAYRYGSKFIEINIEPSNYTQSLNPIFLKGPAGQVLQQLMKVIANEEFKKV